MNPREVVDMAACLKCLQSTLQQQEAHIADVVECVSKLNEQRKITQEHVSELTTRVNLLKRKRDLRIAVCRDGEVVRTYPAPP